MTHTTRWGAVPEALLEDERLGLDSRAVAAWLAIKPAGWLVSVQALRARLQIRKDRWQRIANELESACYLTREKRQGAGGKWIWNIEFNPAPPDVPETRAVAGFPGSGQTVSGDTAHGSAGDGEPGHKRIPSSDIPTSVNTTTTTNAPRGVVRGCGQRRAEKKDAGPGKQRVLIFPSQLSPVEREAITDLTSDVPVDSAQQLLDELTDAIETKAIRTTPLRWFRAVLKKFNDGNFVPLGALRIKARREIKEQQRTDELRTIDSPRSDPRIARPALDVIKRIAQQNRGGRRA